MNALEVAIARKAYPREGGELVAIEGLDFTVRQGQFACIVGPSGCGKTTLLSIIAGLDGDYRGVVSRSGRNLGMVFQTPRLMPWLSARENVRLALDPPPRAPGRAEDMLAEMQLEPFLDAFPRQLSGGQQRRVALARAFVNAPDLLLLDEPTAGLSPRAAEELFGTILALNQSGVAILMVEQNALEALSVSARAYVLVQGRPEREGGAADLAADPTVRDLFLGGKAAPMLRSSNEGMGDSI
jgi:ABC-type nitrate/sulfonate/bicarbonate transport system ATPase subunit